MLQNQLMLTSLFNVDSSNFRKYQNDFIKCEDSKLKKVVTLSSSKEVFVTSDKSFSWSFIDDDDEIYLKKK